MIHIFHKWGKYKLVTINNIRNAGSFGDVIEVQVTVNERQCKLCNLVERKRT